MVLLSIALKASALNGFCNISTTPGILIALEIPSLESSPDIIDTGTCLNKSCSTK